MTTEDDIITLVRERYGPVLDLDAHPEVLIEIIRRFGADDPDGGLPPGGLPPTPTPPPGPTSVQQGPTLGDVMKEVLRLSRQVALLEERLTSPQG